MSDQPRRKRGRPKGSKNKPRVAAAMDDMFERSPAMQAIASPLAPAPRPLPMQAPSVFVAMGKPVPSLVFDTYWRFACERQKLFFRKIRHPKQPPWTDDPVLLRHKFTNVYRASDRVSQYLINHVIHEAPADLNTPTEAFFRTLLFKIFNKVETWELLEREFGCIRWSDFNFTRYDSALSRAIGSGQRIYSAAYIMPAPAFGCERKHSNHLRMLHKMMNDHLPERLFQQQIDLQNAYNCILAYPGIGPFLAYQYAIDLNYGPLLNASENDFVVAGPGALDGIRKCFLDIGDYTPADVIRFMRDQQEASFSRLDLPFMDLWGRALHLIDCQNLFCEVDKYARVAHPEFKGRSDRSRIKQMYRPAADTIRYRYPMKWELNDRIAADPGYEAYGATFRGKHG